uniref:DUF6443 domain-containing protein n=1 Tax=uncultured Algibacter sp. TaxID=298659 RepID=UPI002603BF1A
MKQVILLISALLSISYISGQSNENYISTTTYRVETNDGDTKAIGSGGLGSDDKLESITYYDGLGRPMQSIAHRSGGDEGDIVTPIVYDDFGRQSKEYLPYARSSATLNFQANTSVISGLEAQYLSKFPDDVSQTSPTVYSKKHLEDSPLSRVLEQGAPGDDWAVDEENDTDHTIKFEYITNTTNEVRLFTVNLQSQNDAYIPSIDGDGTVYYDPNELYKTITKDENWSPTQSYLKLHTTEEFKDKQGRVVLKRTYAAFDINGNGNTNESAEKAVAHDTYYVYDDYGNLTYVIPPKADTSDGISSVELINLCYQYIYDNKNRLIEKKIPGKGWEYIVYDQLDRPYLTQDANLRVLNKWLITKYDDFGRVAYTGFGAEGHPSFVGRWLLQVSRGNHQGSVQRTASSTGTVSGQSLYYTMDSYLSELHTINYYDNYDDFDLAGGVSEVSYTKTPITNAKGLLTGSQVKVLDTNNWITTVIYYDDKARPIYEYGYNAYLYTTDKVKYKLDFVGNVLETTTTHDKSGNTISIVDKYTYDHANRLESHKQNINEQGDELITFNHYDKFGQLEQKDVGNTASNPLQEIKYAYNIRGWLKEINNPNSLGTDLFGFKINYNLQEINSTKSTALYNGNISETIWSTANDVASNKVRGYAYGYDALNRIMDAEYGIKTSGTFNLTGNSYDLIGTNYDKNGNIKKLVRFGENISMPDDFLNYNYDSGNKLLKVTDITPSSQAHLGFNDGNTTAEDYAYDSNGNMIKDLNKEIGSTTTDGISYNHLNLPTQVSFYNPQYDSATITYYYDASGNKQSKNVSVYTNGNQVPSSYNSTYYAGNYVYANSLFGSPSLQFFNHAEGYVEPKNKNDLSQGFDYIYQYKDHLGNIRLSYSDSDNDGHIDVEGLGQDLDNDG